MARIVIDPRYEIRREDRSQDGDTGESSIMASPSQAQHRDSNVDFIRFISIIYIVGYWHLFNYTSVFPAYYNQITYHIAITLLGLFIMISGFLIGKKNITFRKASFVDFYKRRFFRIYPPFLFAVLIYGLTDLAAADVLLTSAFLLSVFFIPPPYTLWFVVMILSYYLLAPIIIALKYNKAIFVAVFALSR